MVEFKISLENNYVRLVQTSENHFQELYKVGSNPVVWEQHQNQDRWKKNNFRKYFEGGLNNNEGCFTIIDKKINNRVDQMIKDGFIDEVNDLLKKGFSKNCPGFRALGYQQVIDYLNGGIPLNEMIELIKVRKDRLINQRKAFKSYDEIDNHISLIKNELSKSDINHRMIELKNWLGSINGN